MAEVCITEFTDPGCPWAYSAEPFRRRLNWVATEQHVGFDGFWTLSDVGDRVVSLPPLAA